ncbi:MAG: energy transducer TonB [Spirochaetales bacterium]
MGETLLRVCLCDKNVGIISSFFITVGIHLIIIFLISFFEMPNDTLSVFDSEIYSQAQPLSVTRFIEFELQEFPVIPTENDIIQVIEKEEILPEPIEPEIIEQKIEQVIIEPEAEPVLVENVETFYDTEIQTESPVLAEAEPEIAEPSIPIVLGLEIKQSYISQVVAKLAQNKYYPKAEQNRGREGSVKVQFTVEPNGTVKNLAVHTASRYANLDKAALETVNRSAPFPAFDAQEGLDIILSIDFTLTD